jgi:ATP-dependent exoDNAse (exonuclease V) beta subunit
MAVTGLEKMREIWRRNPEEWWRRYRVKVRSNISKPNSKSEIRNSNSDIGVSKEEVSDFEVNVGTVIGTMVHRMFELGTDAIGGVGINRRPLLQAMAANLMANAPSEENIREQVEGNPVDLDLISSVVSSVEQIIGNIGKKEFELIRKLFEAPGEAEVEFLIPLGRWHITGRFDKLVPHPNGGWEIVDWKTDQEPDWRKTVQRYREGQMSLYALALYRTGRAALIDGGVQVHLALLHHGRVETLNFPLEELNGFAVELEKELQEMDEFGGKSALPMQRARG